MKKKIIYIAHPISGNLHGNLSAISDIYNYLSIEDKVIPFVPYFATVLSLDDDMPELRAIGFSHNEAIFNSGIIDEVWLYGPRISEGMQIEIGWADALGIPIVSKSEGIRV